MRAIVLFIPLLAFSASITLGGSATWSSTPVSGDWSTEANWIPMQVPNGSSDIATFGLSSQTAVSLSADVEVSDIVFNAGASAYTISASPSFEFLIGGEGITNNSGIVQNFRTLPCEDLGSFGSIVFFGFATAGHGVTFTNDCSLRFVQGATAGSSSISNNSFIRFEGGSRAGNSSITCNPISGILYSGNVVFEARASADQSTILVGGGTSPGQLGAEVFFVNQTEPSGATLIANGGVNGGDGGRISFWDA